MYDDTTPPKRDLTPQEEEEFDTKMDEAKDLADDYNSNFHSMPLEVHIRWIELALQNSVIRKVAPHIPDYASEVIEFYRYFMNEFGATTAEEILEILRDGRVKSKVVRLWIQDGLIVDAPEHMPVFQGYPELRDELEKAEPGKIMYVIGVAGVRPTRT